MGAPYEGVDPHEVVHVGMGYEDGIDGLEDAFRQVMDAPAVEKKAPAKGTHLHQEERIVKQTGKEDGFYMAESWYSLHRLCP
jgi:hypothetical protein